MAEKPSARPADDAAPGSGKAKSDSQLRLVTEDDGAVVFHDEGAPSDESPTMISKNPPAGLATAIQAVTPESLLSSLRGRKLAHFELIEPIGVGGMAAVIRARDTQLDRTVALKILPPDLAHDDESNRRFKQEARAAAKLDHENIARVFYFGEDQNLHFIAFEYVEGENLRTILERRGRLPVAEAVRYILQIATGLEHAASRGVVHRDVKPSNIIITPTGRAKLVDMGLARNIEPQTDQLTQSGVTLGTFDYISPEQALEPREADARSDIYSLGCTFYHVLTGQAPVPEGTAAKKMHHHQHVAPIDPRQLNPDIPDEIALILGKMMAKNPKDRYQRPVHLVQHLMQVAQRVGAAADLPEGALFIDAPFLAAPRKRPLLLVSMAVLALAAVLMVLSVAPSGNRPIQSPRPGSGKDKDQIEASPGTKSIVPSPQPAGKIPEIRGEQDLARLFEDTTSPILKAKVVRSFEVTRPGLHFQRGDKPRTLILEGPEDEEGATSLPTTTITWKHQAKETGEVTALFLLEGGDVRFKNLRFQVEAADTPTYDVAAVAVRGPGTARFVRCVFAQADVPPPPYVNQRPQSVPLASVLVFGGAAKGERPVVELEQCFFHSGQAAVSLHSPAEVKASNCAFRPHGATFHLRGDGESRVGMHKCSVFVVTGPAFRLDDTASCQLKIDYSLFSCPDSTISDRDPPHLIHQTDAREPRVTFQRWERNCYHNLNALWSWPTDGAAHIISTHDDFKGAIALLGGKDTQSTWLDDSVNIWTIAAPHNRGGMTAFSSLRSDLRVVRTTDALKSPLGIEKSIWGDLKLKPFEEDPKVAVDTNPTPGERVVDPTLDGKFVPGVYETVHEALGAAKRGDVIRIKHGKNRELKVELTSLKKSGVDVTLKPYDNSYKPILTLANTIEPNAYFFHLHDGEMLFEQLEIVLEPDQKGFNTQTLALLNSNAKCTFRNCVITLKQNAEINPSRAVPLNIVTLGEIGEDMMMMGAKPPRPAAEVVFENCFIRGEGEVVSNPSGRPLDVRLDNTLVGLTGSLVTMQAGTKEAMPGAQVNLSLQRSSVFTSEPMLVVKQGKNRHPKGLLPVRVDRTNNSLLAAMENKPLIATDITDMTEATLRNYLDWKGASNGYNGFERILEDASGFALEQEQWKNTFYRDAQLQFLKASFQLAGPPRRLWLATPDDFKPKAEFQESLRSYGATLDLDQLPTLLPQTKPE